MPVCKHAVNTFASGIFAGNFVVVPLMDICSVGSSYICVENLGSSYIGISNFYRGNQHRQCLLLIDTVVVLIGCVLCVGRIVTLIATVAQRGQAVVVLVTTAG